MATRSMVLQTDNLSKQYTRTASPALDALTLGVEQGEIFGFLGPNGAGKTTTIKILLDLIRPTSGRATLLGLDARRDAVAIHRRVGFLPAELELWKGETARAIIRHFARVRGLRDEAYLDGVIERLTFDPTKKIRTYSTGNKRKLGIILALMHQPELLILDEPTTGLDPLLQQTFTELMREAKANGQTVFLSSHLLSEVEQICDRVAVLRAGKLLTVGRVHELIRNEARTVILRVRGDARPLLTTLSAVPTLSDVTAAEDSITLQLRGDFDPLLRALNGTYVVDMRVVEPTLEEQFLSFYSNGNTSAVRQAS